jgi:hypothetical protein
MYVIRVIDGRRVEAEFSGYVSTGEALRAASQAFALVEAGKLDRAICDFRAVERGPEGLQVVRAACAGRIPPGARVALVVAPGQRRLVRWLARMAVGRGAVAGFSSGEEAAEWLAQDHPAARLSSTELRHRREMAWRTGLPPGGHVEAARRSGAA